MKFPVLVSVTIIIGLLFSIYDKLDKKEAQQPKYTINYTAAERTDEKLSYQMEYIVCIEHLMQSEGFVSTPSRCPAGTPLIGYGHQIKTGEKFTTITPWEGYCLLKSDFDDAIAIARDMGYSNQDNKQLAVAHFIFCLGEGTFQKFISEKRPFNQVSRYIYYHVGNKPVKSVNLFNQRKFEIELYYGR